VSDVAPANAVKHDAPPAEDGADLADDPVGRPKANARAAWSLRALGRKGLPASFVLGGVTWRLVRTVKHDFWAATGFYANAAGRKAVLKMGRTTDYAGVPLEWIGRWLCQREVRFYDKLSDLPNVPPVLGTVGTTGFVHAYVEGRPLSRDKPVPDGFFDKLHALMAELHRRGIAYVDTNKPENILLGDDGLPHLIDFQISMDEGERLPRFLQRLAVRHFRGEDLYHVLKHKRRMRKDELTAAEIERADRKSAMVRLHRFVMKPYFLIRRRTFKRLRESGRLLPEGSN